MVWWLPILLTQIDQTPSFVTYLTYATDFGTANTLWMGNDYGRGNSKTPVLNDWLYLRKFLCGQKPQGKVIYWQALHSSSITELNSKLNDFETDFRGISYLRITFVLMLISLSCLLRNLGQDVIVHLYKWVSRGHMHATHGLYVCWEINTPLLWGWSEPSPAQLWPHKFNLICYRIIMFYEGHKVKKSCNGQ